MLGEGLYPKNSKPIRQPNDALPDVVGQRENRIGFNFNNVEQNQVLFYGYHRFNEIFFRSLLSYVQSYDRRANSHGDLLRERILEPCDWVYSSIDNLAKNCDEALSRAQSSPELDQEPPPKPPKKAPKKPMRKSKRRKDGKNGQSFIKFHLNYKNFVLTIKLSKV